MVRCLLLALLQACVAPGTPEAPAPVDLPAPDGDTAAPDDTAPPGDTDTAALPDTGDTGGDTASAPDPCLDTPDPDRAMDLPALLGRLQTQRCLHVEDQDALVVYVDAFFAGEDRVWCDVVWRASSADGVTFGTPERVREYASVADVMITPGGSHVLVYNDLTPGRFEQVLRETPERFWRRGMVGIGGLGMDMDRGEGFADVPLDLALPSLALVVDPDIARREDGSYRLVTFQVPFTELDGTSWDPMASPGPHDMFRAVSPRFGSFPTAGLAVASQVGERGGADPTVLDGDGEEIVFVGDFRAPLAGWSAVDGQFSTPDAPPDVAVNLEGAAPDAIADPAGGYRLYFKHPPSSEVRYATSPDGHTWTLVGRVEGLGNVNNPSVARDPDGTWWLYYGERDEACVAAP